MTQHTDEMREAFEAWTKNAPNRQLMPLTRHSEIYYYDSHTTVAYQAYQAATASAEAKYLPVIEKLVEALEVAQYIVTRGSLGRYEDVNSVAKTEKALALAALLLKGK